MKWNRLTALAALLALALPAAAQAQTSFWDFVSLNTVPPQGNSPPASGQVYYASPPGQTVAKAGYGSVNFNAVLGSGSGAGNTPLVVFQWWTNQQVPGDEKGVGACMRYASNPNLQCLNDYPGMPGGTSGGEIGDNYDATSKNGAQWLILDLNLITPGSAFLSVTLASLTNGETWFFQVCDTGNANGTGFAGCSDYSGTSSGIVPAIYTTNLSPTDYGKRWARFTPGIGGYVVQGIETDNTFNGTFVAPEPGTMGLLATGLVALAGVGALRRRKRTR